MTPKKEAKTKILIAIFLLGVILLLYPTFGSLINKIRQLTVIKGYEETIQVLDDTTQEEMYEAAVRYNKQIFALQKADTRYTLAEEYEQVLKLNDSSILGYIEVPKANIKLPIYHGVAENTLQQGVGHVRESSLPVGTENQNSLLLGHSGLPTSKIFTNLDKIQADDEIIITVLGRKLYYKVFETEIIEPEDVINRLKVEEGRDLITLVTCTPYGVNTHRLIIHAERTEAPKPAEAEEAPDKIKTSGLAALFSSLVAMIWADRCYIVEFRKLQRGKEK